MCVVNTSDHFRRTVTPRVPFTSSASASPGASERTSAAETTNRAVATSRATDGTTKSSAW